MAEEWHKVWPRQTYICTACQWDIFGSCYCGTCEADRREAAFADGFAWCAAIIGMAEAIRAREAWRVLVNDDGEPYAVDNGTQRRGVEAAARKWRPLPGGKFEVKDGR